MPSSLWHLTPEALWPQCLRRGCPPSSLAFAGLSCSSACAVRNCSVQLEWGQSTVKHKDGVLGVLQSLSIHGGIYGCGDPQGSLGSRLD